MYPTHKALIGHVSPETAFVQDGYPYGRLRCKRRVWVETTKNGQRFCAQTTDPKRSVEFWNKPKCSTYSEVVVLYLEPQEDGREFVTYAALHVNSSDEQINTVRLLIGDDVLHSCGAWKRMEVARIARNTISNYWGKRMGEEPVVTAPLPSWGELVGEATMKALEE